MIIECVPNFSEGRDLSVVDAITEAILTAGEVKILHRTSDSWHNRSVITFAGEPGAVAEAAFGAIATAAERIDLRTHQGVHPRMGSADVVPFVPLHGATMTDCIAVANAVGRRVGDELGIPVYLYEHAATRPERRNLAEVRRGGFEVIGREIGIVPAREPDFGPSGIHPSAGAIAIGARPFLVAFNVYLGHAANLPQARVIARAVRTSSGGVPGVKALAFEADGQAQVSMNLVDITQVTVPQAFAIIEANARDLGLEVGWSEIIGLAPNKALGSVTGEELKLKDSLDSHRLEAQLEAAGLPV